MTTKTFLITVIAMFLLTGITGCDDNEGICIFNVDDPVNDLEWLKNKIDTRDTQSYYVRFCLYQNKENPQKYFFYEEVQLVGGGQYSQQVQGISYILIYNCKGDTIYRDALNDFYIENTLVKQIWPEE